MSGYLGTGTGCARTDVVLDEGTDGWPGIFPMDEFQGLVLPEVANCSVIMEGSENAEMEIVSFRDKGTIVQRGSLSDSKERGGDVTGSLGREERISDRRCSTSMRVEA